MTLRDSPVPGWPLTPGVAVNWNGGAETQVPNGAGACVHLLALTGGRRCRAYLRVSERGGAASGVKWPHGVSVRPSNRFCISDPPPRSEHAQRRTRLPSPGQSTWWRAADSTDRPRSVQPPAAPGAVPPAVKCKDSLCGTQIAFPLKAASQRNKDTRRWTGAASGRVGERCLRQGACRRTAPLSLILACFYLLSLGGARTLVLLGMSEWNEDR